MGTSPLAPLFLRKDAPLAVLTNSIDTLGKAYASTALLVLAGSLALPTPPVAETDAVAAPTNPKERVISGPLQVAVICLMRFCVCPALFLSIILKAMSRWVKTDVRRSVAFIHLLTHPHHPRTQTHRGLVSLDRLMLFVLFLQSSMPSAQNLTLIHLLEGRAADGTRLARLLLWIYVLSCVPLSINLSLFLQRFGL